DWTRANPDPVHGRPIATHNSVTPPFAEDSRGKKGSSPSTKPFFLGETFLRARADEGGDGEIFLLSRCDAGRRRRRNPSSWQGRTRPARWRIPTEMSTAPSQILHAVAARAQRAALFYLLPRSPSSSLLITSAFAPPLHPALRSAHSSSSRARVASLTHPRCSPEPQPRLRPLRWTGRVASTTTDDAGMDACMNGTAKKCITMDKQIDNFKRVRTLLEQQLGSTDMTNKLVSNLLFVFSCGGNDLINFFDNYYLLWVVIRPLGSGVGRVFYSANRRRGCFSRPC
ncbi:hypothetical protein Taro_056935, partial [Colocasia esculenta]|nr:hypothetical protein [Colocasia esculenta]